MTPALDLARRAVAAGAPPLKQPKRMDDGIRLIDMATALVYAELAIPIPGGCDMERALLPLLSDPSWLGWTLAEVERRGYDYSICLSEERYHGSLFHRSPGARPMEGRYKSREAALVAMLEATRPS